MHANKARQMDLSMVPRLRSPLPDHAYGQPARDRRRKTIEHAQKVTAIPAAYLGVAARLFYLVLVVVIGRAQPTGQRVDCNLRGLAVL